MQTKPTFFTRARHFACWLAAGILLTPVASYAQTNAEVIRFKPEYSQGFLVLNSAAYPDVTGWQVDIYKKNNSRRGTVLDNSISLGTKNYIHFDAAYYQPAAGSGIDYSYTITGYGANGLPVVVQGPQQICSGCPPTNMEEQQTWTCNGTNYAWTIKLWQDISPGNGQYYLILDQAYSYFSQANGGVGVPYYMWCTQEYEASVCQDGNVGMQRFYGLNAISFNNQNTHCNDCDNVNSSSNPKIITRHATSPDGLRDMECSNITGDICGIQKYLGPWHDTVVLGQLVPISFNPVGYDMEQLLEDYVNQYDLFSLGEELVCEVCGEGDPEGGDDNGDDFYDWLMGVILETFHDEGGDVHFWDAVGQLSQDRGGTPVSLPGGHVWYTNLKEVNITRLDAPGLSTSLSLEKLFDANEDFVSPSLVFTPGLYWIEFVDDHLVSLPWFVEFSNTQDCSIYDKDCLGVTIYPVPITGNSVNLQLETTKELTFTYTLYGPGSQVMATRNYHLAEGYRGTDLISSGVGASQWPAGNYVHYFEFSDGSTLSYTTLKVNP